MQDSGTIVCKECHIEKPISDYYKHNKTSSGYFSKCKDCIKVAVKKNRELRKDFYNAYDRNRPNKEQRNEISKERAKGAGKAASVAAKQKWVDNNRDKREAHHAVSNAVRDGRLFKQPCFICGELEVQAHHYDYSTPLEVTWLCVKHHAELHRKYDHEQDILLLEASVRGNRCDKESYEEIKTSTN